MNEGALTSSIQQRLDVQHNHLFDSHSRSCQQPHNLGADARATSRNNHNLLAWDKLVRLPIVQALFAQKVVDPSGNGQRHQHLEPRHELGDISVPGGCERGQKVAALWRVLNRQKQGQSQRRVKDGLFEQDDEEIEGEDALAREEGCHGGDAGG